MEKLNVRLIADLINHTQFPILKLIRPNLFQHQKLTMENFTGPLANVGIMMMASVALIAALEAASSHGLKMIHKIGLHQTLNADASFIKIPI